MTNWLTTLGQPLSETSARVAKAAVPIVVHAHGTTFGTDPRRRSSITTFPGAAAKCSIVQELCESRGGRPGLSVLTSLLVSVDVKIY